MAGGDWFWTEEKEKIEKKYENDYENEGKLVDARGERDKSLILRRVVLKRKKGEVSEGERQTGV